MIFQLIAVILLGIFYSCYFGRMIAQRRKGIQTDQIGKGKTGTEKVIELTMKAATLLVPPLEGFWWQDNIDGIDYSDKDSFNWISVIRLPEFISQKDFEWAVETATKKKKIDCSSAEFLTIDEGLCVQIMHLGAFDDEPATVALMDTYLKQNRYVNDMNMERLHHEIYLSDARKVAPEKWKTVIRHPIKRI